MCAAPCSRAGDAGARVTPLSGWSGLQQRPPTRLYLLSWGLAEPEMSRGLWDTVRFLPGPRPTHLSSKSPFKVVSLFQADLNPPLCHVSPGAPPLRPPRFCLHLFGCILNESGPLRFKEAALSALRSVWGRNLPSVSHSRQRTAFWALDLSPSWAGLPGRYYY